MYAASYSAGSENVPNDNKLLAFANNVDNGYICELHYCCDMTRPRANITVYIWHFKGTRNPTYKNVQTIKHSTVSHAIIFI